MKSIIELMASQSLKSKKVKTGVHSPITFKTTSNGDFEYIVVAPQNIARFKRTVPGAWYQVGDTNLWIRVTPNAKSLFDFLRN
jgi:hypothetical protein